MLVKVSVPLKVESVKVPVGNEIVPEFNKFAHVLPVNVLFVSICVAANKQKVSVKPDGIEIIPLLFILVIIGVVIVGLVNVLFVNVSVVFLATIISDAEDGKVNV